MLKGTIDLQSEKGKRQPFHGQTTDVCCRNSIGRKSQRYDKLPYHNPVFRLVLDDNGNVAFHDKGNSVPAEVYLL